MPQALHLRRSIGSRGEPGNNGSPGNSSCHGDSGCHGNNSYHGSPGNSPQRPVIFSAFDSFVGPFDLFQI